MELDSMGLYDIYALHKVPLWQTQWFFYSLVALGVLVGALLIFALAYVIRKIWFIRTQTAWEKALAHLDYVNKNSQSTQHYYDALSTIVKTYVAERFAIDSYGKTDEELAKELESLLQEVAIKPVCAVLRRGIDIKFAQHQSLLHQGHEDLAHIKTFVQSTIPPTSR